MSDAWSSAVVVDPRHLQQLTDEVTRLRGVHMRQRIALGAIAALCVAASAALCLQSTRLSLASSEAMTERPARASSRIRS